MFIDARRAIAEKAEQQDKFRIDWLQLIDWKLNVYKNKDLDIIQCFSTPRCFACVLASWHHCPLTYTRCWIYIGKSMVCVCASVCVCFSMQDVGQLIGSTKCYAPTRLATVNTGP